MISSFHFSMVKKDFHYYLEKLVFPVIVGVVLFILGFYFRGETIIEVETPDVIINTGEVDRHLNQSLKTTLDNILNDYDKNNIIVEYIIDNEAHNYAYEIILYLEEKGYVVNPCLITIISNPISGVDIFTNENGILTIRVGGNS